MEIEIYESLFAINHAATQMVEHIEKLKAAGLHAEELANIRKLKVEELRAELMLTLVLALPDREHAEALRLQNEVLRLEKEIREREQNLKGE